MEVPHQSHLRDRSALDVLAALQVEVAAVATFGCDLDILVGVERVVQHHAKGQPQREGTPRCLHREGAEGTSGCEGTSAKVHPGAKVHPRRYTIGAKGHVTPYVTEP
eukprot:946278-Prymnesium_polylepis.1